MMAVVAFEHPGRSCAIPASQAKAMEVEVPKAELTALWEGAPAPDGRAIQGIGATGRVFIDCGPAELLELPETSASPLSPILRRVLSSLPHVVGIALVRDAVTWLVDLGQLRSADEEEAAER